MVNGQPKDSLIFAATCVAIAQDLGWIDKRLEFSGWKVTLAMQPEVTVATFQDAMRAIYQHVMAKINNGGISYQVLETTYWAEVAALCPSQPVMFYDIKDICCENGVDFKS